MSLKLYNTLTRRKEEFKPITPGKVGMYVCGITAYDVCHIGHARSAVVFDVITRYFRYAGFDVTYVKNFTDVDDKIIERANREKTTIGDVSERFITRHNEDMAAIGVEPPTVTPKATENIDGMIRLIRTLEEKGLAYAMDGDVYYAVEGFRGYGKLSGRNLEDMLAGARVDVNERKRNPLDFALWKGSKEGEPWWDSPWGPGRPGWHIECSVMSQRYLGETFDIHGGGEDLIFPHHENEIAQSEGAYGKPFANYWLHNGFVRINSEKMSKSLGNFFTIEEMLRRYAPEVLRFFMLQSHYRSPVDFSEESLAEARQGMDRCYSTLKLLQDALKAGEGTAETAPAVLTGKEKDLAEVLSRLPERFAEAMNDDFNTARALGYVFDAIRHLNGFLLDKTFIVNSASMAVLHQARETLDGIGRVFGLFLVDPERYLLEDREREAAKRGLDVAEIERLIAGRREARENKDWHRADEIRKELAARQVVLKDGPSGTTWSIQ
ncbi:MAG: cysteine--tRNA ligase [Deltaproteobacteria bacterium HGW-Deltaproteobacteria-19]|jgi:cysteinyl-tRNA synthetase|nr:MAG: cysteine--tRNA ligase [Deltaproteobacteria bacterium HGW-Deltaproteobacteria-19]